MIREKESKPLEIDLTGPAGNAFALLGLARRLYEQLGHSQEDVDALLKEMQSGDYEDLVRIFDCEFGEYVILYR